MSTRERAVTALRAALAERSAELVDTSQGRRPEISILAGGSPLAKGRLSARASGTWQSNTNYGDAYAPERDLGGALFFFLRGIDAPGAGVIALAPPLALIDALDALLQGGDVAAAPEAQA